MPGFSDCTVVPSLCTPKLPKLPSAGPDSAAAASKSSFVVQLSLTLPDAPAEPVDGDEVG